MLTINSSSFQEIKVIEHIFIYISFYCMYKEIIETGLKRPYALMIYNLNEANKAIESKASEVNGINKKLDEILNHSREIEEILFNNQMGIDLLSENSPVAIFAFSEEKFIFANNKGAELFGVCSPKDILGKNPWNFIPEANKERVKEALDKIYMKQGKQELSEAEFLRADGQVIEVVVVGMHFKYKGKDANLCFCWDISSRDQLEILRKDIDEKNRLLDESLEHNKILVEFFSNISHEFKTPLNVILGAIQVLNISKGRIEQKDFDGKLDKYSKIMMQNCFRLLRLINNLIDLSKFDAGDLKLNMRNYNIVSVVEDITLSVTDYVENKGIELIFDTNTEEKIMAFDADKIERIILNLLSNAIKFTNEGGKILVTLVDKIDNLSISVKDTGIGIPEDRLNIIFNRFEQVDKTLSRNREGSGIGLSLVKSLVEMHGGTIDAKSNFGEGSEFIIELPVVTVDNEDFSAEGKLYESKVERINIEFSDIYNRLLKEFIDDSKIVRPKCKSLSQVLPSR